jgi:hypothetical protein
MLKAVQRLRAVNALAVHHKCSARQDLLVLDLQAKSSSARDGDEKTLQAKLEELMGENPKLL